MSLFAFFLLTSFFSASDFQGLSVPNSETRYVDSNQTPSDTASCGSTNSTACTTIAQALAANSGSADTIQLLTGEHDSEVVASTISRTVTIIGSNEKADDASLRVATADINGALFTINATVTFLHLQLIVILDTQFLLLHPFLQSTQNADLTLQSLAVYSRQYAEDVFVPIQNTFFDCSLGALKINKLNVSGLPFQNDSLFKISTEPNAFRVEGNCTFADIFRQNGHGSVFNVEIPEGGGFKLTNTTFYNCSAPSGNGGALRLDITGKPDSGNFELSSLSFRAAGRALAGRFMSVHSNQADNTAWTDILKDSHTEIYNHFIYYDTTETPPHVYPLNNYQESILVDNTKQTDSSCGSDEEKACASISAALSSELFTKQKIARITIIANNLTAETDTVTFTQSVTIRGHVYEVYETDRVLIKKDKHQKAMFVVSPSASSSVNADPSVTATFANLQLILDPTYSDSTLPVFEVQESSRLVLVEVHVRFETVENTSPLNAPIVSNSGFLELIASNVSHLQLLGSSLLSGSGTVYMSDGCVFDNITNTDGSAVLQMEVDSGLKVVISGTNFTNCVAKGNGGAISLTLKEGSEVVFGDIDSSATLNHDTMFRQCKADTGYGGGVYLNISEEPSAFTIRSVYGMDGSALNGTVLFVSTGLTAYTSGPKYWAHVIAENDRSLNKFVIEDTASGTTKNLFEFVPSPFYVDTQGTDSETCGKDTAPCNTIHGATQSLEKLATTIQLLSGTHAAETQAIKVVRSLSISGNTSHTIVKKLDKLNTTEQEEALFISFFDATFHISNVNFTIVNDLTVPFVMSKSKYVTTLQNVSITMETGKILSSTLFHSIHGRLAIQDSAIRSVTLQSNPLITPSREYRAFSMSNIVFEDITRNKGNGSVIEFTVNKNYGLYLNTANYTNNKCEDGYGGSIYIEIAGQPLKNAFRLYDLWFSGEAKAKNGTYVYVRSAVDGFIDQKDVWADLLDANPDATDDQFVAEAPNGTQYQMATLQEEAVQRAKDEEDKDKKKKFYFYLIVGGGSLVLIIIIVSIICCCCCCCRKKKEELGSYRAANLLDRNE